MTEKLPPREEKSGVIGEPVNRPNGWRLEMERLDSNSLFVWDGPMGSCWSESQLLEMGDGNYDLGAMRIGQIYYKANPADIFAGADEVAAQLDSKPTN